MQTRKSPLISSALRLGLHTSTANIGVSESQIRARTKVFAAVIKTDTYASLILGLPPFIRMQDIEVNMTNLLSQSTPDVPPSPRSKAAAMHFDLLRMTVLSRDSIFPIQSDQEEDYVDPQHLVDIEKKLRTCSHAVPGLASESVTDITCSTEEAKSAPLVCFHHRSSFERVVPNPRACWTIASSFA
jgi:hypothetical protein